MHNTRVVVDSAAHPFSTLPLSVCVRLIDSSAGDQRPHCRRRRCCRGSSAGRAPRAFPGPPPPTRSPKASPPQDSPPSSPGRRAGSAPRRRGSLRRAAPTSSCPPGTSPPPTPCARPCWRTPPRPPSEVMELDLSSMASVRKFAADFNAKGLPLNILVNNAGVMAIPFTLSNDGIEMQFATNHVGHFLLTHLLLENMKKTSRESNVEGRIVNVSSEGHRVTYKEGIRFDKINDEAEYGTIGAYGQSKLANILHANELARRFKEEGVNITANSLHPGSIITNLLRYHSIIDVLSRTLGKLVLKNANQGAATTCYVALHPGAKGVSGKYFCDSNVYEASEKAKDVELAKKLWDLSVELTT